jgi:hypothetical protein
MILDFMISREMFPNGAATGLERSIMKPALRVILLALPPEDTIPCAGDHG